MPFAWSSDVCSRSEEHTSELQSHDNLVCRLLLEKEKRPMPKGAERSGAAHSIGSQRAGAAASRVLFRTDTCTGATVPVDVAGTSSFFFNDTATTERCTLSLHAGFPI